MYVDKTFFNSENTMLHITDSQHSIEAIKQKLINFKLCFSHDSNEQISIFISRICFNYNFSWNTCFYKILKKITDYICITDKVILVSSLWYHMSKCLRLVCQCLDFTVGWSRSIKRLHAFSTWNQKKRLFKNYFQLNHYNE